MPLASWPPGHSLVHVQVLLTSTRRTFSNLHLSRHSAPACGPAGLVVTQGQEQAQALGLVEPQTSGLSPSMQPVQIPLQSLPALQQINTPTQLSVSADSLRVSSIPSQGSLIKIFNRAGPSTEPWEQPWVEFHSPTPSALAIPTVLCASNRAPGQAMSSFCRRCCGKWCPKLF